MPATERRHPAFNELEGWFPQEGTITEDPEVALPDATQDVIDERGVLRIVEVDRARARAGILDFPVRARDRLRAERHGLPPREPCRRPLSLPRARATVAAP